MLRFQKKVAIASCVCRTILIRRALESPDPGASNGGSNFIFGPFGADLVTFEVAGSPKLWFKMGFSISIRSAEIQSFELPATSKVTRSAPKCPKIKFDPPFDAPGSGLSSARRINILRQTREAMATFF